MEVCDQTDSHMIIKKPLEDEDTDNKLMDNKEKEQERTRP